MEQNNGIIYIATNLLNGKQYVGQTTRTLKERFKSHKYHKQNTPFTNAIHKYGIENFKQIYFSCPIDELSFYERFLIKELNTLAPKGYNLTNGGEHYEFAKEVKNRLRKNHADFNGDKNPNFDNHKIAGKNNPFYGKTHSQEIKNKLSKDRIERGLSRGENNPKSKLTKKEVIKIKRLLTEKILTQKQIGECFNVGQATISTIKCGTSWSFVK